MIFLICQPATNAKLKFWTFGEVAEWLNATVSKTVMVQAIEGSNPSLSVFRNIILED